MITKPETDTPETDQQINGKLRAGFSVVGGNCLRDAFVPSEFARNLERERDAAENESLEMARLLGMSGEREAALLARLDEANREIARLQMELDATCNAEELARNGYEVLKGNRLKALKLAIQGLRLQMELDATCNAEELRQARQERNQWCECAERLAGQMQRLADCDWVITLPDRMDAVRDVARNALAEFDRLKGDGE